MKTVANRLMLAGTMILLLTSSLSAQKYGKELYEYMQKTRLVKTEGTMWVSWLPDGSGYFFSEKDTTSGAMKFIRVEPESGEESALFPEELQSALLTEYARLSGENPGDLPFSSFDYVMQGQAILFKTGSGYFLFDLKNKSMRRLLRPEIEKQPGSDGLMRNMRASQLWNGTWSPDYTYFAYVKGYDLYITDSRTGEETRLTHDGNENIFNGRPNWVYPEEFGQLTAYWWSPDGKKLAYYSSDETEVYKFPIVHHLKPEAGLELQSYPKAGETNPTVYLKIIDIASGKTTTVDTRSNSDTYIIRPTWLQDGSALLFMRMNRDQNYLELLAADPETGTVRTILEEKEEFFINLHDDFYQLADGRHFLWSSERSGWRQLYLYRLDGTLVRQLTRGKQPVEKIVRVDEKNKWVYFTAFTNDGLDTQFFRVRLNGKKQQKLTSVPGSHYINMDPRALYYTDMYSSFTTPLTVSLHRADGTLLRTLASSNIEELEALPLEKPELITIKAADGETDLHGLLFKPAGYDANKAYPLVVSVYGGPHSKMIRNSFQMAGREQRLAQLGFMVWKMDNRGLTRRGKHFETRTYRKLGQVDLDDQAAGVREISKRPYIDADRVGIFGHSYGGYMTCLALLKFPQVFHVGVAGAPVTDWRNYDTIYTERYMSTPQKNPEGYDQGSAMPFAGNLTGKLLLVHGTIDNNVHPGNTIQLIDALVKAGKRFDLMLYPNNRHGIRGKAGRHYRQLTVDYLSEHLNPEPVVAPAGQ